MVELKDHQQQEAKRQLHFHSCLRLMESVSHLLHSKITEEE